MSKEDVEHDGKDESDNDGTCDEHSGELFISLLFFGALPLLFNRLGFIR